MTISGSDLIRSFLRVSGLRMSPTMAHMRFSKPHSVKYDGSESGFRAYPYTWLPISKSHVANQPPLKPVWPVINTSFCSQNSRLTIYHHTANGELLPFHRSFNSSTSR